MLFCSEEFVFLFLPMFLLAYYLIPAKMRNVILFSGSLLFYIIGERQYFYLILISLILHFSLTTLMEGRSRKIRRLLLTVLLCYDFGSLFLFKYMDFFVGECNKLLLWLSEKNEMAFSPIPEAALTLPLGISFYTIQIAAYAIDVYRRPEEREKNFISLGAYLTMFPQLIAGPIVLYKEVSEQLKKRRVQMADLEEGLKIFTIGLGYKMLISNILGLLWNEIQVVGVESISAGMAWLGAFAFSLQLYFDFNGYSLMAMGLGRMLGFTIPRNFRQPYMAVSVTDFWRRWHITLSTWFREYLYIPLGGNRKGRGRMVFNLFVVWALTGLWHGASWNFVLWGLYYFLFLTMEKLWTGSFWERHKVLGRVYTVLVAVSGWVIFALEDIREVGIYLKKMFLWFVSKDVWAPNWQVTVQTLKRYGWLFVIAFLLSTCLPENLYRKYGKKGWFLLVLLAVFWLSVYQMVTAVNNPFLYFRF